MWNAPLNSFFLNKVETGEKQLCLYTSSLVFEPEMEFVIEEESGARTLTHAYQKLQQAD